eukprot:TRINITY_DN26346_c0_g1_i1.p1 TRINITY_DN26346_c0_g1~~TRINITY_DN26346_c0_g1_i1.p1  ORF type:complete len:228 (+),score=75.75 TRINITY_DN26346_c0_g1_i1:98-685(+)
MGGNAKRGERARQSVGEERSRMLGMIETGKVDKKRKRQAEEEEEAARKARAPAAAVEVEGATGEMECLVMTWHSELRDGQQVEFDGSSGISMQYFINNIALHNYTDDSELKACVSIKHTPQGVDNPKPVLTPLATVTPVQPHTVLQCVRFTSTDSPKLVLKIIAPVDEDISKVRVTVCGEQIMQLTEAQVAAILM